VDPDLKEHQEPLTQWCSVMSQWNPQKSIRHYSKLLKQKKHSTYNITKRSLRLVIFAIWKQQILHILNVSVQHKIHMCHIVLSSVACLSLLYLSTLSHKGHDFREKKLLNTKCVLIFSTTVVRNISHSKKNLDIVINVHASSYKVPVILVRC